MVGKGHSQDYVLTVEGVMEWVEVEWPPQDIDHKSSLRSLALLNHNISS